MRFSDSSFGHFLKCPRDYKLYKIDGITPKRKRVPLIAGQAGHAFLDAHMMGLDTDACLERITKVFDDVDKGMMTPEEIQDLDIERVRITAMCKVYTRIYEDDPIRYPKILAEKQFEFPLVDDHTYMGIIDVLMQDTDGDWWVKETKFQAPHPSFDVLQFNSQILGETFGAQELIGTTPKGVLYDVVRKTKHRPAKSKNESIAAFCNRLEKLYLDPANKDDLFIREPILVGPNRLNQWFKEKCYLAKVVQSYVGHGVWPKNTGQCKNHFGTCDYLPICSTGVVDDTIYKR